MRTSTLQYLYLQKPISTAIIVCLISTLPWLGVGGFSSQQERQEAMIASTILKTGEWTLPQTESGIPSYCPPMAQWVIALCSYPQGEVNTFTARLPSALAFAILIAAVLIFFGKRIRFQEAFIATFLLLTCFEMHRAGMTAGSDMLFTMFLFLSFIQLYRWENKLELKGLPVLVPLLLSGAILTKGVVGIILPLFVFGVYLLILRKYCMRKVLKTLLYTCVSSLFLPLLWYISAWKEGGDAFLSAVWFENIGRLSPVPLQDGYTTVPVHSFWYHFVTLFCGFFPWTLLAFFSLFGLEIKRSGKSVGEVAKTIWSQVCSLDKIKLFSLVASVCIFVFYSIPAHKQSMDLLPVYPFIGLFLSQLFLYITEHRSKVTRVFATLVAIVVSLGVLLIALFMVGALNPAEIPAIHPEIAKIQAHAMHIISQQFLSPSIVTILLSLLLLATLGTVYYQMFKRINIKMLYATILLTFCVNLLYNAVVIYETA
ncbi:glycosyltransferase family 39 protein [Parabacteroides sp. Marseille-P3160]|uniref:ArnT family glycosyltransferase n=1 Tax=Parabacteroides sp. Marseille-P3160 TaxID=1917887 RepID=UPI0009BC4B34|nr:glycosyltransferase family 39 protein [Parabacteroides sp. Marseille-P3160]